MDKKQYLVEFKKKTSKDYMKPIAFNIMLIVLALLLNSEKIGKVESLLTIISVSLVILLIPLNQIFIIRRVHIYRIYFKENLIICYQELLKKKIVEIPLGELDVKKLNTSIRGCPKLLLGKKNDKRIVQYCNSDWTIEYMTNFIDEIRHLKNSIKNKRKV